MNEREIDERLKTALQNYRNRDYPAALRDINEVLRFHPDNFRALYALTNTARAGGSFGIALLASRRLVDIAPKNVHALNCYGKALDAVGAEDEAMEQFQASFAAAQHPVTALHIACILVNRCEPRAALEWFDRARALPGYSDIQKHEEDENESFAHLALRNWRKGWQLYSRTVGSSNRPLREYRDAEIWEGQKTGSLVVYTDQGIGDAIMFASCLPDVRARAERVIIDCEPRMEGLLRRSFPWATVYPTRISDAPFWLSEIAPQHKTLISELPSVFRNADGDFTGKPYLVADPRRRTMYRALLDGIRTVNPRRPKIGIAWTGGLPNTGLARRSLDLADLEPIMRAMPEADFVSLQYMDAPEAAAAGVHHFPFATQTKDYDDTAALVAELDAVVTVQTAIVHLAGALGVPCSVIVSDRPVWRYGSEGERMPWYESVRLYRKQDGDWQRAIAPLISDLQRFIASGAHYRKLPLAAA